jgi:hypothetical protein
MLHIAGKLENSGYVQKDISTGMLGYLPSLMHAVLDLTHACSTRRSRMQIEIIESGAITVWRRYIEQQVSA